MRNLTIRREKTSVACLIKMKIYLEDEAGDTNIGGVKCRRLGELKNGEEKTFIIDGEARRVYVIADQLSKGFSNEFFRLPEGEEDVYLSGRNRFNLANGNAFRFNGNDGVDVSANRKKGMIVGAVVLAIAMIFGFVVGFGATTGFFGLIKPAEKTFSAKGMTITLTDDFKEEPDTAGFTVCYVSRDVAVMAMRENGKLIPGFANMSLDDYRNYYQNAVDESTDKSVTSRDFGNIPGFIYEAEVDGEVFTYYCFTYKTDKDFWMLQIAVQSKKAGKYEEQIIKWAESAKFD